MSYRDELESARARVAALEDELARNRSPDRTPTGRDPTPNPHPPQVGAPVAPMNMSHDPYSYFTLLNHYLHDPDAIRARVLSPYLALGLAGVFAAIEVLIVIVVQPGMTRPDGTALAVGCALVGILAAGWMQLRLLRRFSVAPAILGWTAAIIPGAYGVWASDLVAFLSPLPLGFFMHAVWLRVVSQRCVACPNGMVEIDLDARPGFAVSTCLRCGHRLAGTKRAIASAGLVRSQIREASRSHTGFAFDTENHAGRRDDPE